ncbi:MAG TPA: prepilin-type N-terminal cleavage/methylation domain-containing protein [Lysobacter sp.]|nr:prepilin-type N-terminal cleavage/methylation domain-containing protein [Lysobacter sp.]
MQFRAGMGCHSHFTRWAPTASVVARAMTRMSASCRRNRPLATVARSTSGFTLLELLIVLALIAVASAMVAPRLQRTYDAVVGSGERAEVRRQLEQLPLRARRAGQPLFVNAGAHAVLAESLQFPDGWQVSPLDPIRIEASGLCTQARVRVEGRGGAEIWTLVAPDCRVADAR